MGSFSFPCVVKDDEKIIKCFSANSQRHYDLKPPNTTGKPTRCPTSSAVQHGPTWPWRCIC